MHSRPAMDNGGGSLGRGGSEWKVRQQRRHWNLQSTRSNCGLSRRLCQEAVENREAVQGGWSTVQWKWAWELQRLWWTWPAAWTIIQLLWRGRRMQTSASQTPLKPVEKQWNFNDYKKLSGSTRMLGHAMHFTLVYFPKHTLSLQLVRSKRGNKPCHMSESILEELSEPRCRTLP